MYHALHCSYGQLGVSNTTDVVCTPVLYCLQFLKIKYMDCGEEHSVALINVMRSPSCVHLYV